MKTLHLLASNTFSGAENVVIQIIKLASNQDFQMAYCSMDGPIKETLESCGVEFFPLKKFSVSEIMRVIKRYNPDVIHTHDVKASIMASLLPTKIKHINTIHMNDVKMRRLSLKSFSYYLSSFRINHTFWVSDIALSQYAFRKISPTSNSFLRNIVDKSYILQKANEGEPQDFDVIYVGRLAYPKNPKRLLSIASLLKQQDSNVTIGIIGAGEEEEQLRKLAEEKDLSNISFLGFKSNPLPYVKRAKMLIMTSEWEGTPMSALEAMALGKPIISTPVGGLKELIINEETGFLCENDEEFCTNIIRCIRDDGYLKKLSNNTLRRFDEIISPEDFMNEIRQSYNS